MSSAPHPAIGILGLGEAGAAVAADLVAAGADGAAEDQLRELSGGTTQA